MSALLQFSSHFGQPPVPPPEAPAEGSWSREQPTEQRKPARLLDVIVEDIHRQIFDWEIPHLRAPSIIKPNWLILLPCSSAGAYWEAPPHSTIWLREDFIKNDPNWPPTPGIIHFCGHGDLVSRTTIWPNSSGEGPGARPPDLPAGWQTLWEVPLESAMRLSKSVGTWKILNPTPGIIKTWQTLWDAPGYSAIKDLESVYVIDDRPAVATFIEENRLRSLVLQAVNPLNAAFGEASIKTLTLVHDDEGFTTLFCLVMISGDMQEARRALNSFDQQWWLARSEQAAGKLNFDFELI